MTELVVAGICVDHVHHFLHHHVAVHVREAVLLLFVEAPHRTSMEKIAISNGSVLCLARGAALCIPNHALKADRWLAVHHEAILLWRLHWCSLAVAYVILLRTVTKLELKLAVLVLCNIAFLLANWSLNPISAAYQSNVLLILRKLAVGGRRKYGVDVEMMTICWSFGHHDVDGGFLLICRLGSCYWVP